MTTKSCSDCPRALPRNEVARLGGKDVGAEVCETYGHVLGGMTADISARTKLHFGTNCPDHGKERTVTPPRSFFMQVAKPDQRSLKDGMAYTGTRPASCNGCKFLIESVYDDTGWLVPLCAATGRLIFPNKAAAEAKNCTFGVPRDVHDDVAAFVTPGEMELFAWYDDDFGHTSPSFSLIDAARVASSRAVTAHEESLGIRAIVEIEDQAGFGPPVELPAFRSDVFASEDIAKIPQSGAPDYPDEYVDHSNFVYTVAAYWLERDRVPMLISGAGLGKTEGSRHLAMRMGLPFDRISFNENTDPDDVLGTMLFVDGETRFKYGTLSTRWVRAGVSLWDEFNRAPQVIQDTSMSMFDNAQQLVLEHCAVPVKNPDGTITLLTPPPLKRHAFQFSIVAINPAWDPLYHGTRDLDGAVVDRLKKIELTLPPEDVERAILMRAYERENGKLPPKKLLDSVMSIARELRALVKDGSLPISWGMRPQIDVICDSKYFPLATCYRQSIADYLEPQARQLILDVVSANERTK